MISTALLLAVYLIGVALLKTNGTYNGIPDMVSDTYYQLGKYGWVFSVVMILVALGIAIMAFSSGLGITCLAFIGSVALMFVGAAPNYLNQDEYKIHKSAAIIASLGSIGWCLSINVWPTLIIALVYLTYLCIQDAVKLFYQMFHTENVAPSSHPWYWAEVSAFLDVFITYWITI